MAVSICLHCFTVLLVEVAHPDSLYSDEASATTNLTAMNEIFCHYNETINRKAGILPGMGCVLIPYVIRRF
jgi:hypothetical protein